MNALSKPLCLLMTIALTVWHGAYAQADGPMPGPGDLRAVAPRALAKPSSGTPQSATPRAVCTFASIGLYWTPDGGAEDKPCHVRYRAAGEPTWREALPLWFDKRIGEYRGSIVQLQSGTTYEVHLELVGGGPSTELRAATWSETFPITPNRAGGRYDRHDAHCRRVGHGHRIRPLHAPRGCRHGHDRRREQGRPVHRSQGLVRHPPGLDAAVAADSRHRAGQRRARRCDRGLRHQRLGALDKDGWGVDYDSAIYSKYEPLTRVIIQRNHLHHPRSNANCWLEFREGGERYHPKGPAGNLLL